MVISSDIDEQNGKKRIWWNEISGKRINMVDQSTPYTVQNRLAKILSIDLYACYVKCCLEQVLQILECNAVEA